MGRNTSVEENRWGGILSERNAGGKEYRWGGNRSGEIPVLGGIPVGGNTGGEIARKIAANGKKSKGAARAPSRGVSTVRRAGHAASHESKRRAIRLLGYSFGPLTWAYHII